MPVVKLRLSDYVKIGSIHLTFILRSVYRNLSGGFADVKTGPDTTKRITTILEYNALVRLILFRINIDSGIVLRICIIYLNTKDTTILQLKVVL